MTPQRTNVYGRRPGRGVRPWLLIPKVLAVAVYFGSLVAAAAVWFTGPRRHPAPADPQVVQWLEQVADLFRFVVVPALLVAVVFGLLLFLQHPRQFMRLRWWQVKIAWLAVFIPVMHLYMSSRLERVRSAVEAGSMHGTAERQFEWGLAAAILGSAFVIFLGRYKPRFWQNWARAYRR